ncbi:MAG TPA: tRNA lysidine(34) synthetase TilS [Verrucomicrobia bacterium]|nr:MAG: tRNA lysidine(34) synthetase TilS [Lentisphaerae bacterium GWF2_57_35]HBA85267.1 tRNA lysidine(34) synthetase TilS [Verrucomicrobiota bacterium]
MIRKIQQTIRARALLKEGQHVLLAVSGGADSVALAYALHYVQKAYGLHLTLAHLHHSIRGSAADEDAEFVQELAAKLGCACRVEQVDVPVMAVQRGLSLEMAAREARYDFFSRMALEVGAHVLATGHTADDQAETVLLKLARGAGPQGLGGIAYVGAWKGLRVIRPLRDITHAQACAFLRRHGLGWREDASNLSLHFLRNRVRHEVLPLLETRLNPNIRAVLTRTAEVMSEENAWLDDLARERLLACVRPADPTTLSAGRLGLEPLAARRRIAKLWLSDQGAPPDSIDFAALDRILQLAESSQGSRSVPLPGGWLVSRHYDALTVKVGSDDEEQGFCQVLAIPGETILPEQGLRITTRWDKGIIRQKTSVGQLPSEVSLDAGVVKRASGLVIRSWRAGDAIRPLGMTGSRKLQDLFVDAKLPKALRKTTPILACRKEVVWLAGYRVARGWEVKKPQGISLRVFIERI